MKTWENVETGTWMRCVVGESETEAYSMLEERGSLIWKHWNVGETSLLVHREGLAGWLGEEVVVGVS
jgi:hypothetical protein